jgi:UDP-glucose 6-dehydrogenase
MNIAYIGGGFVGTCSAAVTASSGHTVLVYDIDTLKVDKLNSRDRDTIKSCLFEEGLDELLLRHQDRISFTSDKNVLQSFFETVQVVFMCLPTPELGETGETDLRFYESAAHDVGRLLAQRNGGSQSTYVVIVNKSTVPIDMVDMTETLFFFRGGA